MSGTISHKNLTGADLHIPHMTNAGDPNGSLTGLLNQLCYDTTNKVWWINTNGATAWIKILTSSLAVRDFIHDDGAGGKAISTMAFIPPFITSGLPQAALNGLEMGNFFVDVYENSQPSATSESRGVTSPNTPGTVAACSRPGVVPWTDIDWQNARIAASNRVINGRACHLITPYENASLLYLQLMSNFTVKGNNYNGRDVRDATTYDNYGIFDPVQPEYRTLTGTGPASWWSNGIPGAGIHGMVGNIYSWEDARFSNGLYQPKGYLNGAVTANSTKLLYDDNSLGDGPDICHLMPGVYTITDAINGNEDVTIARTIITGRFSGIAILASPLTLPHGDDCAIQLKNAVDITVGEAGAWKAIGKLLEDDTSKKLAFPDKTDTTTHIATYLDSWYPKSIADCVLLRGGRWISAADTRRGLLVNTSDTPVDIGDGIGFRSALSIGNL